MAPTDWVGAITQHHLPTPLHSQVEDDFDDDGEYEDEEEDQIEEDVDGDGDKFAIPGELKAPREVKFTTDELHHDIYEANIDMCPPYQRDVVWPNVKQSLLIDSIFRNLYIPPIVFAVTTQQMYDGPQTIKVCIDGKQRLTSIHKFRDGMIPWKHPNGKSYWYNVPNSFASKRTELPEVLKKLFNSKLIKCVEYDSLPEGADRELFQRVQLGMSLTAAEKLQAVASPWAEWICDLEQKHILVQGGLGNVLKLDLKRGRNFQNLAHMVFLCEMLPTEILPHTKKVERWLSGSEQNPTVEFKDKIDKVLTSLWQIGSIKEHKDAFTKIEQRLAPVEFVFVGVLLFKLNKEGHPLNVLAKAAHDLRKSIRAQFKDIRTNEKIGKAMWKIISQICKNVAVSSPTTSPSLPRKRKRVLKVDDDNADDDALAPLGSVTPPAKRRGRPPKPKDETQGYTPPKKKLGRPRKQKSPGYTGITNNGRGGGPSGSEWTPKVNSDDIESENEEPHCPGMAGPIF